MVDITAMIELDDESVSNNRWYGQSFMIMVMNTDVIKYKQRKFVFLFSMACKIKDAGDQL